MVYSSSSGEEQEGKNVSSSGSYGSDLEDDLNCHEHDLVELKGMLSKLDPADNTAHIPNVNYRRLLKRGLKRSLGSEGLSSHATDTWWREYPSYTPSARAIERATTSDQSRRDQYRRSIEEGGLEYTGTAL